MESDCQHELIPALLQASEDYADLLTDYKEIALCNELSEEAEGRLEQIYAEAEEQPMLNFLLTELDHILNRQLGLLDSVAIEGYKDQQAWLRERLEQAPFEYAHRQQVQKMLAEEGFYEGPIDGVFGNRSTQAMERLNTQVQELLHERGLYTAQIDGVFGRHSIKAVRAFQKSKALEDSGTPNRETFLALQSERQSERYTS